MVSVVDSGRQRQLLQQAQALIAELKSLPLDIETNKSSFAKVFDLVRTFKRFQDATASMPPGDMKVMWEQRSAWVQDEVAALAAERIQAADHRVFWSNLYHVLLAAADACESSTLQVDQMTQQLHTCAHQLEEERAHSLQLQQAAAAAQAAPPQTGWTEEAFEMKSKAVVAQQELHKRTAELGQATTRLQFLEAERESLQRQVDELRAQHQEAAQTCDRQIEVIQGMMVRSEETAGQLEGALRQSAEVQQHCRTLSVNLEANARVIEKLIELNSELMDALNQRAATQERQAATASASAAASAPLPAAFPPHAPPTPLPAAAEGSSSMHHAVAIPPQLPVSVAPPVGSPSMAPAGQSTSTWSGGPTPPTVREQEPRGEGHRSTSSHPHSQGGADDSFSAAFSAFLMDPGSPRQATAASLAAPGSSGPPSSSRQAAGGVLSTARNLVKYVAGGDLTGAPPGGSAPPSSMTLPV